MNTAPPLLDEKLTDSLGNYCRITMHQTAIAPDLFEVYFHPFNDAIPSRFVGDFGECGNRARIWVEKRKEEGFA